MKKDTLTMQRLFFRKSKNGSGQDCFISKIREYVKSETGKRVFTGDSIVIANTDRCGIDRAGRWTVEVREMFGGKGYLVNSAQWTVDVLDFVIDWEAYNVYLLVNGEETKLKKLDRNSGTNRYLPLSFRSEDFYPIERIASNIMDKTTYLQLGEGFDVTVFLAEFQKACHAVYAEFSRYNDTPNRRGHVGNTPFADGLKKLAQKK